MDDINGVLHCTSCNKMVFRMPQTRAKVAVKPQELDDGYYKQDLITRLRTRAEIRRSISSRKSVQEGKPDRIAALLEEAADALERNLDDGK